MNEISSNVALADPISAFEMAQTPTAQMPVPYGGAAVIMAAPREVTAKKVAVPRSIPEVMKTLRTYAAAYGDAYVYSWTVNDRRSGRKSTVEGGTISLANDLLQIYGNCSVDVEIHETPTHMVFRAQFVDYERGTSLCRLFQQRKSQDIGGKYDADRAADMVFQIGQSKAIRNVVLNALSSLADFTIEEAKKSVVSKFGDPANRDKAWAFIEAVLAEHGVALKRVEVVIGRPANDWTARDLAKAYQECKAIREGMAVASEVFPSEEDADDIKAERDDEEKSGTEEAKVKRKYTRRAQPSEPAAAVEKSAADVSGNAAPEPAKANDSKTEPMERNAAETMLKAFISDLSGCNSPREADECLDQWEDRMFDLPRDIYAKFEDAFNERKLAFASPDPTPAPSDDDGAFFGDE